jgi:2,3-bisphosphoglycerate-independent phosphoglycerate mutase
VSHHKHDVIICNSANPDMVGHTGKLDAAIAAIKAVDACLGRCIDALLAAGGTALVTADHGNAEQMLEPDGTDPHTAHTTNPVPLFLTIDGANLADGGTLSDLVPTCLNLLGIPPSVGMTGRDLVTTV